MGTNHPKNQKILKKAGLYGRRAVQTGRSVVYVVYQAMDLPPPADKLAGARMSKVWPMQGRPMTANDQGRVTIGEE